MPYEMKPLGCDPGRLTGLIALNSMLVHEAYFESLGTSAAGANLAAATPILALDMYEHSYHMDYGARAAAYVDAVMNNLNLESAGRKLAALQGA